MPVVSIFIVLQNGNKDINNFPFLSSVKRQEERPVLFWWWRFKLNFYSQVPIDV